MPHGNQSRFAKRIIQNEMKAKLRTKCRDCAVARRLAGCLFECTKLERVMRELDLVGREEAAHGDPILEQIKQCPEAFKAGELVGKLFDSIKYAHEEAPDDRPYLPPAGAVLPPFA